MENIPQAIIDELIFRITELSDKSFQQRVWLGMDKNIESCFHDSLFFMKHEVQEDALMEYSSAIGLNDDSELKKLILLLKEYDYHKKTDKQIMENPKWEKVVKQAKVVLDMYQKIKNVPDGDV